MAAAGSSGETATFALDASGAIVLCGSHQSSDLSFGGPPLAYSGLWDMFVAKLNADRSHAWSYGYGTAGQQLCHAVGVDSAGNVYATGRGGSFTMGGPDVAGPWLVKFDSSGVHQWSTDFDTGSTTTTLVVSPAGEVIQAGSHFGTTNFGGDDLTAPGTEPNIFLVKLDTNMNHVWSYSFGDSDNQNLNRVILSGSDVVVSGYFSGTLDFGAPLTAASNAGFVAKLDSDGNYVWAQQFVGAVRPGESNIAADAAGNVYLAGSFDIPFGTASEQFTPTSLDIVVVKLAADTGAVEWMESFGASGDQSVRSVAVQGDNLVLTGSYGGVLDFGCGELQDGAAFVARLAL